jgi:acetyl-CoA carboxylase biotin carboxylase subunit
VTSAVFPVGDGIRVDTHVQAGTVVPPFYDSLLAKLVVHGDARQDAVAGLRRALARCRVGGVTTDLPLHAMLVRQPEFVAGAVDTASLTRWRGQGLPDGADG